MTKDKSVKSDIPRRPTSDRREEYDFYLSVLSEVLPQDDENDDDDSTVDDNSNSDESSVDEYALSRRFGRAGQRPACVHSSLRHSASVPLEVVFNDLTCERPSQDEEDDEPSLSSDDVCMMREMSSNMLAEQNMEALGQLSVSESIGSLPRSRAARQSSNGTPTAFHNSASGRMMHSSFNNSSGRFVPNRRARSGSMESMHSVTRLLVRESRSFIPPPAAAAAPTPSVGSSASTARDQAPRRPRQGLRILDLSDTEDDEDDNKLLLAKSACAVPAAAQ